MTPYELLNSVKARFTALLHDDEDTLIQLLKNALIKYQDLAGVSRRVRINQDQINSQALTQTGYVNPFASHQVQSTPVVVSLPADFLARLSLADSTGDMVASTVWADESELELKLTGREVYPLVLSYLVRLDQVDINAYQIPASAVSLISDYLEILIQIPNSERLRRVSIAGKLDTTDIPIEADLLTRKLELEERIKTARAVLPVMTVRG